MDLQVRELWNTNSPRIDRILLPLPSINNQLVNIKYSMLELLETGLGVVPHICARQNFEIVGKGVSTTCMPHR